MVRLLFSGPGFLSVLGLLGAGRWLLARASAFPLSGNEALLQERGLGLLSFPGLLSGLSDGPPLVPLGFAAVGEGGAGGLLWFTWAGLAGGLLAAGLVWLLARELVDSRRAFWAALLFATLPVLGAEALVFDPALAGAVFWGLALVLLAHALRTDRALFWAAFGIVAGVGILAHWAVALVFPCLAVFTAVAPEMRSLWRRPGVWIALCLAALLAAPLALSLPDALDPETLHLAWAAAGRVLWGQLALFGPLLVALVLWLALDPRGRPRLPEDSPPADQRRMTARSRFFLSFCLPVPVLLAACALAGLEVPLQAGLCAGAGACLLVADRLAGARVWRAALPVLVLAHAALSLGFLFPEEGRFRSAFWSLAADHAPLPDDRSAREVAAWLEALCQRPDPLPVRIGDPAARAVLGYALALGDRGRDACELAPVSPGQDSFDRVIEVELARTFGPSLPFPQGAEPVGYLALETEPPRGATTPADRWIVARAFLLDGAPGAGASGMPGPAVMLPADGGEGEPEGSDLSGGVPGAPSRPVVPGSSD
nr:glycosyltransferase family 39 protein [Phaeovibrio sulfidiphilus]